MGAGREGGRECCPQPSEVSAAVTAGMRPEHRAASIHCWALFEMQYIFLGWRQREIQQQLSVSHPIHTFHPQWCRLTTGRGFSWVYSCAWITGDTNFVWRGLGLGSFSQSSFCLFVSTPQSSCGCWCEPCAISSYQRPGSAPQPGSPLGHPHLSLFLRR